MHKLYELKDKLIQELEDYADNSKYSKEDVESIKYMASAVDHLCNIMEGEEEYSMDAPYMKRRPYGYAYARGQKRDSMGRYSRERGYSRAEDFKNELHELMADAPNEQVKMEMRRIIDQM